MNLNLSQSFKKILDPTTGRELIQLTYGEDTCYPLYYFIDSFTKNCESIVYHRAKKDKEVQLYLLNLKDGTSVKLSSGVGENTEWKPWDYSPSTGIYDHLSVLNKERNEVYYFSGNEIHKVELDTLKDSVMYVIPSDRVAIGQNCTTPNGEWLVYIHHDKKSYIEDEINMSCRQFSKGTELCALNTVTGEHRMLLKINSPIHHVMAYDNEHFIINHPTNENGMIMTDIKGGWYTHLRTQDEFGGCICHNICTSRGIAYEVLGGINSDGSARVMSGMYNPFTHEHEEFVMPDYFGYTHTAADPDGKLVMFETFDRVSSRHEMYFLEDLNSNGEQVWKQLTGNWETYGMGQRSHYHPRITPDRKYALITGGDPKTKTNHLFLMDISDLKNTANFWCK